jgi:hypothetical protein
VLRAVLIEGQTLVRQAATVACRTGDQQVGQAWDLPDLSLMMLATSKAILELSLKYSLDGGAVSGILK